jgi:S1-C subfamily serine protease
VVGFDLFDDVAVVRTDPRALHLVPVPLGSSQAVHVGEPVAAIGSPFDEPGSLSVGVVSQVGRQIPAPAGVCFLTAGAIQTDAAINHGNSGGPLFDAAGRVIGINAQIDSTGTGGQGVGFAVPIDAARRSLRQILASGQARYAWLGVITEQTVTPSFAQRFGLSARSGALVGGIAPNSPAAAAGLRAGTRVASYAGKDVHPDGDVIVQLGRYPVRSLDDLQAAVTGYPPGQTVAVRFWRGGDQRTAQVRLAARPLSPAGGCDALDRR